MGHLRSYLGSLALGNGRQLRLAVLRTMDGLVVSIPGRGAGEYVGRTQPAQVRHDFPGLTQFETDVLNLTDFINDQFGPGASRHGHYLRAYCEAPTEEENGSISRSEEEDPRA